MITRLPLFENDFGFFVAGRQAVKRVLKRCVICKKLDGPSHPTCNSPDLPRILVSEDPPFTHVGIDFAGPLYVRASTSSENVDEKCYVCLFTCATTRAVHLKLTRNLTVDSFLLAFRTFTSRRGLPTTLVTDNAKTFRGTSRERVKNLRSTEVLECDYVTSKRIQWNSWWGGFSGTYDTERQTMFKEIGRTTVTYDEVNTLCLTWKTANMELVTRVTFPPD